MHSPLQQERRSWIQWLGYKFRDNDQYDEFTDLLDPQYKAWAKSVLGRDPYLFGGRMGGEPTKDYFRLAFNAATLEQLNDFRQLRYIVEHSVPDGWTLAFRATLCAPPASYAFRRVATRPA